MSSEYRSASLSQFRQLAIDRWLSGLDERYDVAGRSTSDLVQGKRLTGSSGESTSATSEASATPTQTPAWLRLRASTTQRLRGKHPRSQRTDHALIRHQLLSRQEDRFRLPGIQGSSWHQDSGNVGQGYQDTRFVFHGLALDLSADLIQSRKLRRCKSTVPQQPSTKVVRCDCPHHAVPIFDMSCAPGDCRADLGRRGQLVGGMKDQCMRRALAEVLASL